MGDVARLAGVAPMTVSNCYRAPGKVRPDTFAKVEAAARKLGYVRNLVAGGLASGRSQAVGVLVPSLQNSNFIEMVQGLEDRLSSLDHHLMLSVAPTRDKELASVRTFIERQADGIVLTGVEHDAATVDLLRRARVPVVETWRSLHGPLIDMGAGFSLYDAAFDIVTIMIGKGYRRIGFAGLNPPQTERFFERQRGYQDAMRRAGLRDDLLAFSEQPQGFRAGRITLESLLAQEPALDAIFCATDVLAVGALFECMRRGWPVPGRLGIAGYGDYEIASEVTPTLTTVRTRGYDMGVAAANLIVDDHADGAADTMLDVGYEVIERNSL